MSVAPPRVDRGSKPGVKGRDYVNLTAMRSLTVRDSANLARREGNLQRSKSAAADFESEGYLYMESPKRTDSSTRYSKTKKDNKIPEETDGNEQSEYEFMFSQKAYMNCETPAQTTQKLESSNERNTPVSSLLALFVCLFNTFVPNILKGGANQLLYECRKIGLGKMVVW